MKRWWAAVFACVMTSMAAECRTWAADEVAMKNAAAGNTAFAVDLYQHVLKGAEGQNLFLSPFSISSALGMTAEGARGETAEEMRKVLHAGEMEAFRSGMAGLNDALLHLSQNKPLKVPYELNVANALWVGQQFPLDAGFQDITRKYYLAEAFDTDFAHDADAARTRINDWVAGKTHDRITALIAPGGVNRQTALVLTNAIYFKGTWEVPFSRERTQDEPFHLAGGTDVDVPMMRMMDMSFGYAETDDLQAVSLPYKSTFGPGRPELSMVVILPKKADGLAEVEKQVTAENLRKWTGALKRERVQVFLPRFTMSGSFELSEALKALGMESAFSRGAADFSGISSSANGQLSISGVVHKAFVDVNEEGTEAAAATGVVMAGAARMAAEVKAFRADHPFLLLIRHEPSGAVLFMGHLANPKR